MMLADIRAIGKRDGLNSLEQVRDYMLNCTFCIYTVTGKGDYTIFRAILSG